jgi:hypothetical protein
LRQLSLQPRTPRRRAPRRTPRRGYGHSHAPAGAGRPALGGRGSDQLTSSGTSSTAALERSLQLSKCCHIPYSLPERPLAEASRQIPPCHRRTLRAVGSPGYIDQEVRGAIRTNSTTRAFVLRSRSMLRFTLLTSSYSGITWGSPCLGDRRFSILLSCKFPVQQPISIGIKSVKDLGMCRREEELRHQHC